MAQATTEVVLEGPGSINLGNEQDWEPGFATLHLEYTDAGPESGTRAVLNVIWTTFDRNARVETQIELTTGDLFQLAGVASAMHAAAKEDYPDE